MIARFTGRNRFLSNFEPAVVCFDGLAFPTVEHAFQAAKTHDPEWQLKIQRAATPGKAKSLGRRVPLIPAWDEMKVDVMRELVRQKFESPRAAGKGGQNERLFGYHTLLLKTGEVEIVEGNDWHDVFWGKCGCPGHGGKGENWLGRLLMEVREELMEVREELREA